MEQANYRKRQAQLTRSHIIDCALELFARDSYEAVTIQEICKRSGISVGAFYHHFASKELVITAAFQALDHQLEERWQTRRPHASLEAARQLVVMQAELLRDRGTGAVALLLGMQLVGKTPYILDRGRFFPLALHSEVERSTILGHLKGDPRAITNEILLVYRGLIFDWCLRKGRFDLPRRSEAMVQALLVRHGMPE